jgi:malate dehydrogenase (oxaloacetate-decarboxylating)(NADP+)
MNQDMVKQMAAKPLILALANPEPEIRPELVKAVRPDALIATGRSDYPNQVNNVLCFPFMFRGALDVGATTITQNMQLACVRAIADLARAEQAAEVAQAYGETHVSFGPEYLIPRPFDPRLIIRVAPAVAKAAMDDGIALRPIADFDAYRAILSQHIYHSGMAMRPVFATAKKASKRVVYCDGEDDRVLRAVQTAVDEHLARPILIGRPEIIDARIARLGLRLRPGSDVEVVNPNADARHLEYSEEYRKITSREGVTPEFAKLEMRRRQTLIGCMALKRGEADAVLCGPVGHYRKHLRFVRQVIGQAPGVKTFASMNMLLLPNRTIFVTDTYVNDEPTAEQLAEMTLLAAEEVKRFGLVPRAALLSHSNFGSDDTESAHRMRAALAILRQRAPQLEVDGEMHADAALSVGIREKALPDSVLTGEANLLIMPNLDAANISFNLLKTISGDGVTVGPILLGAAKPVHILSPSSTVRRIVNMTALAAADAVGTVEPGVTGFVPDL